MFIRLRFNHHASVCMQVDIVRNRLFYLCCNWVDCNLIHVSDQNETQKIILSTVLLNKNLSYWLRRGEILPKNLSSETRQSEYLALTSQQNQSFLEAINVLSSSNLGIGAL